MQSGMLSIMTTMVKWPIGSAPRRCGRRCAERVRCTHNRHGAWTSLWVVWSSICTKPLRCEARELRVSAPVFRRPSGLVDLQSRDGRVPWLRAGGRFSYPHLGARQGGGANVRRRGDGYLAPADGASGSGSVARRGRPGTARVAAVRAQVHGRRCPRRHRSTRAPGTASRASKGWWVRWP